jgi:hypothetical protein
VRNGARLLRRSSAVEPLIRPLRVHLLPQGKKVSCGDKPRRNSLFALGNPKTNPRLQNRAYNAPTALHPRVRGAPGTSWGERAAPWCGSGTRGRGTPRRGRPRAGFWLRRAAAVACYVLRSSAKAEPRGRMSDESGRNGRRAGR